MERKPERLYSARFKLGRQSSLQPKVDSQPEEDGDLTPEDEMSPTDQDMDVFQLLFYAHEGNLEGIKSLLSGGLDVNSADLDKRTALHVASCEGHLGVVKYLIQEKQANVNVEDRWGSTPLRDANHYGMKEVSELLEKHGGRIPKSFSSMRTENPPEYEMNPDLLLFVKPIDGKGNYSEYNMTGTKVVVKTLSSRAVTTENLSSFRDELRVLQKLRHPNVVQFLGAVTQTTPMMIVTEHLPMVLRDYLDKNKRLEPAKAVKFALDVARGMNYLHERKPEAIVLHDLSPRSLMRDKGRHVKVAGFGASLLLREGQGGRLRFSDFSTKVRPYYGHADESRRYMAPELTREEDYDCRVDVFSFALILHEMIEGAVPFAEKSAEEAAKCYAQGDRPPFRASSRHYPCNLKGLIEQCWRSEPSKRPMFDHIIKDLEEIRQRLKDRKWVAKLKNLFKDKGSSRGV